MFDFLYDNYRGKKVYILKQLTSSQLWTMIHNFAILIAKNNLPKWVVPNHLTIIGQLLGIISIILAIQYETSSPKMSLIIGFISILSWWCDEVDGFWAMTTNRTSFLGQIYDHGIDFTVDTLFIFVTTRHCFGDTGALILFLSCQMGAYLIVANEYLCGIFEHDPHADFVLISCIVYWVLFGIIPSIMTTLSSHVIFIFAWIILLSLAGYHTQLVKKSIRVIYSTLVADFIILLSIYIFWFSMYFYNILPNHFTNSILVVHVAISAGTYILLFVACKIAQVPKSLFSHLSWKILCIFLSLSCFLPYFIPYYKIQIVIIYDILSFMFVLYHCRLALIQIDTDQSSSKYIP
jgi:hypothetical protein